MVLLRESARSGPLSVSLPAAHELLARCEGRVLVTGMGKSGHIARKIAATLASTGSAAHFVHPAEAGHGDLGMICGKDAVLALSWSGETAELAVVIAHCKRFGVPLVGMTSAPGSALATAADVAVILPSVREACPHGLAPTTSTSIQLLVGDALAISLLRSKGFTPQDFRVFHPGGKLGAILKTMADLMHTGDEMPLLASGAPMSEAIIEMSAKGFGIVGIVSPDGILCGVITDGDLRRRMSTDLLSRRVDDVMSANPVTFGGQTNAQEGLNIMNDRKISAAFVTDNGVAEGVVHLHDLLRAGVA